MTLAAYGPGRSLLVALGCVAMMMDGALAAPILTTSTPDAGWSLQARARNGGANAELTLQQPAVASRNAPGTPAWVYGQSNHFQMTYTAASGILTLGVDFSHDGTIGTAETVTHAFDAYAGQGFRLANLLVQGSATGQARVEHLTINGVPFGTFGFTQNNSIQRTFSDTTGIFHDLVISGDLILSASGGSDERPRMILRLGDAVPLVIAETETVPEPSGVLVLGAAGALFGLMRRKRAGQTRDRRETPTWSLDGTADARKPQNCAPSLTHSQPATT